LQDGEFGPLAEAGEAVELPDQQSLPRAGQLVAAVTEVDEAGDWAPVHLHDELQRSGLALNRSQHTTCGDAGKVAGQQQRALQRGGGQGALSHQRVEEAARLRHGGADRLAIEKHFGDEALGDGDAQFRAPVGLTRQRGGDGDIGEAGTAISTQDRKPRLLDLAQRRVALFERCGNASQRGLGQHGIPAYNRAADGHGARLAGACGAGRFRRQKPRAELRRFGRGDTLDDAGLGRRELGAGRRYRGEYGDREGRHRHNRNHPATPHLPSSPRSRTRRGGGDRGIVMGAECSSTPGWITCPALPCFRAALRPYTMRSAGGNAPWPACARSSAG
jgi:hypothetical protein